MDFFTIMATMVAVALIAWGTWWLKPWRDDYDEINKLIGD